MSAPDKDTSAPPAENETNPPAADTSNTTLAPDATAAPTAAAAAANTSTTEKPAEGAAAAASGDHISLKVVGQDGNEVFFKIKKHTPLRKLIDAYCQRQGVAQSSVRFLYDGRRIGAEQTPKELLMEDGDIIDAMLQQTGGR